MARSTVDMFLTRFKLDTISRDLGSNYIILPDLLTKTQICVGLLHFNLRVGLYVLEHKNRQQIKSHVRPWNDLNWCFQYE